MTTPKMCNYCFRVSVATVTRRRNTFMRTLFGRARPTVQVCRNHLAQAVSGWSPWR